MSSDSNELARNLRNRLANRGDEIVNPTEGQIITGMATTQNMSSRAGSVRAVRPPLSPEEALFSDEDPEGTKYYMAPSGVMNTPRKDGTRIEFVRGVYKTAHAEDIEMLDYLCGRGVIRELLPPEPASLMKKDPMEKSE